MPSSSLRRMAASSNRVSAAIQGFFSFSREMGTGRVCLATVHASGNIMAEAGGKNFHRRDAETQRKKNKKWRAQRRQRAQRNSFLNSLRLRVSAVDLCRRFTEGALLKQQLGHVCGLAIHCDGPHELAAAFEGGGQRY